MKESRFIELLNLYIDQQIPPEDAAALEEEILADPHRRRTYEQYCRMHRACTLAFEGARARGERSHAGDGRPAGALVGFEPAASRPVWPYYAAGVAAAACVALVAVQVFLHPGKTLPRASLVALPAALPAAVQPVPVMASAPWRVDPAIAPAVFPRSAPLTVVDFATVNVPARTPADPLRPSLEDFVFDQASTSPSSPPTFRSRPRAGSEIEMTAFQFQR